MQWMHLWQPHSMGSQDIHRPKVFNAFGGSMDHQEQGQSAQKAPHGYL